MAVVIRCSNAECRKSLRLPDRFSQKPLSCPACGQPIDAAASLAESGASVDAPLKADSSRDMVKSATRKSQVADDTQRPRSGKGATLPGQLGRFVIQSRLGAGACGTVYRAYDPHLEREVALKVPNPGVLDSPKRVARFLREAKSAANLRHPHIVPVYDAGRDNEQYYIATAFIAGQPLADRIEDQGNEFRQAAIWTRELAEALAYAHEQRIVHRDVKPANCMVDQEGRLHLMDFGLAFRQEEQSRLTNDGTVLGTPAYMAPEQAAGREAGPAADQYSVGVILYELLTGRTPFAGPVPVVIHNQIHTDPDPPHRHRRNVSKDLETICLKTLSKESGQRYDSCQALADDLRRWLDGEPIVARRVGTVERLIKWTKRNPLAAGLVATVALVLVAGTVISTAFGMEANRRAMAEAQALKQATEESERARAAEAVAKKSTLNALQVAGLATFDKAFSLCQHNETAQGILWFSKAMSLAEQGDDATLSAACRYNLAAWEFVTPQLDAMYHTIEWSHGIALRPDGKQFAVAIGSSTDIQFWDTPGTNEAGRLTNGAAALRMFYTADGHSLITGGDDGLVRRWNLTTNQLDGDVLRPAPGSSLADMVVNSQRTRFATASKTTIQVWDVERWGTQVLELSCQRPVAAIAFDSGDAWIWSGTDDGTVQRWNLDSGTEVDHAQPISAPVRQFAPLPKKGQIAAGIHAGLGPILMTATPPEQFRLDQRGYNTIAVSPDGYWLASGNYEMKTRLWNTETRQPAASTIRSVGMIRDVDFAPDSKHLIILPQGGHISRWILPKPYKPLVLSVGRMGTTHLAWSNDRLFAVNHLSDCQIHFWRTSNTGTDESRITMPQMERQALLDIALLDHDNLILVCAREDRQLPVQLLRYNSTAGETVGLIDTGITTFTRMSTSGDGEWVAVSGRFQNQHAVRVWNVRNGSPLEHVFVVPHYVSGIQLNRNGSELLVSEVSGRVFQFDVASGKGRGPSSEDMQINGLQLSSGQDWIITGTHDGLVRQRRRGDWSLISPVIECPAAIRAISLSPNDQLVAVADYEGVVRLYHARTARQIGPSLHRDPLAPAGLVLSDIEFSPDGTQLAVADVTGTILVYNVPVPWLGDADRVRRRAEVSMGLRIDESEAVMPLSTQEWLERIQHQSRLDVTLP